MMRLRFVLAACGVLGLAVSGYAYSTYANWGSVPVTFLLNPANSDVSPSAAVSATQTALDVWNTQGGSSFRYQYGGTASDTANAFDNRNVILFRNASNGSTIATTYSWWDSSNHLLDSDIIVWDANFTFFTGSSGCGGVSNAAYLEDILTHELGHALGLNHSTVADATMYPAYSYCSQELRTLASDDIAGIQTLYSGSAPASRPANQAPTVTITSPANGAVFLLDTSISLAGTAYDAEDGNLSSALQWNDNGTNLGSTGSLVSLALTSAGTHTFTARVFDSGGLLGSSQVSVTVTVASDGSSSPAPAPAPAPSPSPSRGRGKKK